MIMRWINQKSLSVSDCESVTGLSESVTECDTASHVTRQSVSVCLSFKDELSQWFTDGGCDCESLFNSFIDLSHSMTHSIHWVDSVLRHQPDPPQLTDRLAHNFIGKR